jgi:hypothetical protein
MALGSTRPLAEMSTRNLPEGRERTVPKIDNLTAVCEPIVYKMWEPRFSQPYGPPWLGTGRALSFFFLTLRFPGMEPGSAVGISTGYGLVGRWVQFESHQLPDVSLLHVVQTGSGARPTSYPMRTGRLFPRG